MKRNQLYIITVLIFTVIFSGCKYETDIANPNDYVKVYMPQATETTAKRTFAMADSLQTIIFGAAYGGPNTPASDIEVRFRVDNQLVDEFNLDNGTDYSTLPQASYTLETTTAIIPQGHVSTAPLKIRLKTRGALEAFKQYLLPISIDHVGNNIPVNENLRTSYFLIEAQREGILLKVMSYGKGNTIHDMNLAANIINGHNPDILLVREMDSVTTRSGLTNAPVTLSELIGMPYHLYAVSIPSFQTGKYGATIYSRYPITKAESYPLPSTASEKGPLGIITVKLNDNQSVVFAGTHLNANATIRGMQTPVLIEKIKDITDPFIIAGNFNDRPPTGGNAGGATYTPIIAQAGLTLPCSDCPPNVSTSYSDFIMYKPADKFRVISHTVGATSTSTHLPVITQFLLYKD